MSVDLLTLYVDASILTILVIWIVIDIFDLRYKKEGDKKNE